MCDDHQLVAVMSQFTSEASELMLPVVAEYESAYAPWWPILVGDNGDKVCILYFKPDLVVLLLPFNLQHHLMCEQAGGTETLFHTRTNRRG